MLGSDRRATVAWRVRLECQRRSGAEGIRIRGVIRKGGKPDARLDPSQMACNLGGEAEEVSSQVLEEQQAFPVMAPTARRPAVQQREPVPGRLPILAGKTEERDPFARASGPLHGAGEPVMEQEAWMQVLAVARNFHQSRVTVLL
jgi:hypothetical protein